MKKIRALGKRFSVVSLLLLLSFAGFAYTSHGAEENLPKETIRATIRIGYHPAYGAWVSKIVVLEFEDVEGLPIETDNPAFERLHEAKIKLMSWGRQGYAIRVLTTFDLSIGIEKANETAKEVSDIIMRTINQSSLKTFFTKPYPDNTTIKVIIDRGFLPKELGSIEGLLKYRPTDGFASLITENLLRKTVPGNISGALNDLALNKLEYILRRTNTRYGWNFKIGFDVSTALKNEEWVETIDLNLLLLKEGLIKPLNQRTSKIIIEIPKKHSIPKGTYEMSLENISPVSSPEEDEYILRVTYDITASIDNVLATVRVSKRKAGFEWNATLIAIVFIVAMISISTIAVLIKRRKSKKISRLPTVQRENKGKRR